MDTHPPTSSNQTQAAPTLQSTATKLEPDDRPPLPPGHPLTWRLLTDGTILDGSEYPFPVFID